MWTVIKLAIALVLLNAVAQAGLALFHQYKFQDAVQEALLFSQNASDAELVDRVMAIAQEQDVPIDASDVVVTRKQFETDVAIEYTEDVVLVPGVYTKAWTFAPSASVRRMTAQPPTR